MEEAHRKTDRPTRATKGSTHKARTAHGQEKAITWWDATTIVSHRPKNQTHMENRSKTKSSMVNRPKYSRAVHTPTHNTKSFIATRPRPTQARHGPKTKTNSFMATMQTFMSPGTATNSIQQISKEPPNYTVRSSRNRFSENVRRLSFLV